MEILSFAVRREFQRPDMDVPRATQVNPGSNEEMARSYLRLFWVATIALTIFAVSQPAHAGRMGDFWATVKRDYRRNHYWPHPFIEPDRMHIRAPFDVMTDNGWRRQNMLGSHHFDPNTSALTKAGEIKVRWILTQVPPHRRTIFIERGTNRIITSARIDAVEQTGMTILPAGALPDVRDTHLVYEGRPAANVHSTMQRFQQSQPAPVLPAATSSGSQ